jgi:hypothetical protein
MCGRYRLSRRKQIVEEHFASVSGEEDWEIGNTSEGARIYRFFHRALAAFAATLDRSALVMVFRRRFLPI